MYNSYYSNKTLMFLGKGEGPFLELRKETKDV